MFQREKVKKMARETGLEPATSTVTGWYSNQLSYSPAFETQKILNHSSNERAFH